METTLAILDKNPLIVAVRNKSEIDMALASKSHVIFLMGGSLSDISSITRKIQQHKKHVFIHIELIKGLGRDREAVDFIATNIRPEGIVSTKPQLLKAASRQGLITILQIFMIDSQAFDSGIKSIESIKPDGIEIMPGLMPRVIAQVKSHSDLPLIAAGLIKQPHEIDMLLDAGCQGVTVSEQSLWNYIRS